MSLSIWRDWGFPRLIHQSFAILGIGEPQNHQLWYHCTFYLCVLAYMWACHSLMSSKNAQANLHYFDSRNFSIMIERREGLHCTENRKRLRKSNCDSRKTRSHSVTLFVSSTFCSQNKLSRFVFHTLRWLKQRRELSLWKLLSSTQTLVISRSLPCVEITGPEKNVLLKH